MAAYTTIEQLQKHLEIDYLEQGDETLLNLLLNASESRLEKEINQPLSNFVSNSEQGEVLDAALVAAILIFAGTLYANREAVAYTTATPVPYTLGFLLEPFKLYR